LEAEARRAGHRWLRRASLAFAERDDLALECQQHTGDRHHEDDDSSYDARHEVQPEDDLAQLHAQPPLILRSLLFRKFVNVLTALENRRILERLAQPPSDARALLRRDPSVTTRPKIKEARYPGDGMILAGDRSVGWLG
jgi:hypothetical protein